MRRNFFILIAFVSICFACDTRQQPWNPIFEDTSFQYLDNSIQNALESLEKAENQLNTEQPADASASLDAARQICLALKDYYIPLTEVRQQVYDADRFFYLRNKDKAKGCLEESRRIIQGMSMIADGGPIQSALVDLVSMIDGCILSLDGKSETANDQFKTLGHKVNLMLIKGGLTISNTKFS